MFVRIATLPGKRASSFFFRNYNPIPSQQRLHFRLDLSPTTKGCRSSDLFKRSFPFNIARLNPRVGE